MQHAQKIKMPRTTQQAVIYICFIILQQTNFDKEWRENTQLSSPLTKSLRDPNAICTLLISLWPSQQFQLLPQLFAQIMQPHLLLYQSLSEFSDGRIWVRPTEQDIYFACMTAIHPMLPSEIQQSLLHVP